MKNQSRLAKALEDQAKALENLRRKQEQVAKANKRSREMELKKAASVAARNTAKGKKIDTKKAAKANLRRWMSEQTDEAIAIAQCREALKCTIEARSAAVKRAESIQSEIDLSLKVDRAS